MDLMAGIASLPHLASLTLSPGAVVCTDADGRRHALTLGPGDDDSPPVLPDTQMYGASLAKQVTGILVAQQCARGLLAPEMFARDLLPAWPSWAHEVTMSHLLHHTSGLPQLDHRPETWSNGDVLAALHDAPGMTARPGATFAYDNTGYVCLAEILRVASGRSVDTLAAELFGQLGMSSSMLSSTEHPPVHGHAQPPRTVGDGGLWTSADDFRRWNDAMNSRLLGEVVHQYAETPGQLADGWQLDYAWGVRVLGSDRHRLISHGGSWPSWTAKSVRRPDMGTSVVLLSASDETEGATDLCHLLLDRLG